MEKLWKVLCSIWNYLGENGNDTNLNKLKATEEYFLVFTRMYLDSRGQLRTPMGSPKFRRLADFSRYLAKHSVGIDPMFKSRSKKRRARESLYRNVSQTFLPNQGVLLHYTD